MKDSGISDSTALFINSVSVTVLGPRSFTATADGVLLPEQIGTLPVGAYQITASKTGYVTASLSYVVGPDCKDIDQFGACHIWVAMQRNP